MSHFSRLDKAQIADPKAFGAACKELGFTEIAENTTIRDYAGKTVNVNIAAKAPGARYEVALVKNGSGKFDMVADWWGIRQERYRYPGVIDESCSNDADVQNALLRTTTKHAIVSQYRRQGFMARVTVNKDQSINVSLTR